LRLFSFGGYGLALAALALAAFGAYDSYPIKVFADPWTDHPYPLSHAVLSGTPVLKYLPVLFRQVFIHTRFRFKELELRCHCKHLGRK